MKRYLIILLMLTGCAYALAQAQPAWLKQLPQPSNATFYYRMTKAEGLDYEKVYARAFAKAVLESTWKMGVEVEGVKDVSAIEQQIADSLRVTNRSALVQINKVCEYTERRPMSDKLTLYVLWQVATSANKTPLFDDFNDCR